MIGGNIGALVIAILAWLGFGKTLNSVMSTEPELQPFIFADCLVICSLFATGILSIMYLLNSFIG